MQPLVPTSLRQPNPKGKHPRHLQSNSHALRTIRVGVRTKARLIWMSCGVISTASSVGFLAVAMAVRVAPGEVDRPVAVEEEVVFNPT